MKRLMQFCLIVIVSFMVVLPPLPGCAADESQNTAPSSGPRRHLATIIFSGLGGAALGLSTLSFYGRPQDRLGNIGVGFALGIIAGTAYVTYEMVKTPTEFYGVSPLPRSPSDHTLWESPQDRNDFTNHLRGNRVNPAPNTWKIANFNWSF